MTGRKVVTLLIEKQLNGQNYFSIYLACDKCILFTECIYFIQKCWKPERFSIIIGHKPYNKKWNRKPYSCSLNIKWWTLATKWKTAKVYLSHKWPSEAVFRIYIAIIFLHSYLPVLDWRRVVLLIFDPKQLLWVSFILWCYYSKCISISHKYFFS